MQQKKCNEKKHYKLTELKITRPFAMIVTQLFHRL